LVHVTVEAETKEKSKMQGMERKLLQALTVLVKQQGEIEIPLRKLNEVSELDTIGVDITNDSIKLTFVSIDEVQTAE
jgi:hypothetical protein